MMRKRRWLAAALVGLLALLISRTALAAEVAGGEIYRLPAGQVVADDLYVSAREIYIDGTVQGDLIGAGAIVQVNGTVAGDALLAGAQVAIGGEVQDDVRAAGAAVDLSGTVGDDLIAAAGGGFGMPFPIGDRTVQPGLRLADSAAIGGDALLAGGQGTVDGTIGGRLRAALSDLTLAAQVAGDAELFGDQIAVREGAQVAGILRYTSDEQVIIPEGVAADVEYRMPTQPAAPDSTERVFDWVLRTLLILVGFAALGWMILRLAPGLLTRPASALAARPGRASLYGVLAALGFVFLPLASVLLVVVMVVFWGWLPGVALGLFLFGVLALLWFLSPLVTGLWLGRALGRGMGSVAALLLGVVVIVLLGRIPIVGWFVYLVSFVFALGGLILAWRASRSAPELGAQAA
jgi:cytoskeletal protein CcmA (bactofilin family)